MDLCAADDDAYAGEGVVYGGYHFGFFVGCSADHEYDDVLWFFFTCLCHASVARIDEWVHRVAETALSQGGERFLHEGGVLGVDVFHALQTLESRSCA